MKTAGTVFQTYRQEVADHFNELDEDNRRLVVRGDIKQWNQMLAETAHNAGVITNEEFAIFQNAGYMGLYGGLDVEGILAAVYQSVFGGDVYLSLEEKVANLLFNEIGKSVFRGRCYTNETGRLINWTRLGSICWIYNICCTFHSFDFWTWKLVNFRI